MRRANDLSQGRQNLQKQVASGAEYDDAELRALISTKQDTLTFDTLQTDGSPNPVTSGGLFTAIAGLASAVNGAYASFAAQFSTTISNTSMANQTVHDLSMTEANMRFMGVSSHTHNHRGIWPADVSPNVDDNYFIKVEELGKVAGNNRLIFNSNGNSSYRMGFQVVKNGNNAGLYEAIRIESNGLVKIMNGMTNDNQPTTSSDDRLKINETPIQNALQTIRQVKPTLYTKVQKEGDTNGALEAGVIAQELETIPELAFCVQHPPEEVDEETGETNYLSVAYTPLLIHALAALQELDVIVRNSKNSIAALTARVEALEAVGA